MRTFASTALVATAACGGSGGASDAGPVGPVVMSRLALGDTFACGITRDGGVKCWGSNHDGQLGNSAPAINSTVDFVTGLTGGVTDVAQRRPIVDHFGPQSVTARRASYGARER